MHAHPEACWARRTEAHEELGPIDIGVIGYTAHSPMTADAIPHMVDLVERVIIRVLDVRFVMQHEDGTFSGFEASDFFFSSRRRHTISVSAFLLNRSSDLDGWFIVFDTLTLADDRLEAFYDNPNALRDYFRDIGRMVLAAEGRKANDSHADCYQYFCVPEYGTANGRLHFHAVHFMRTLPTGSVDPNFGRRVRNRRQLNSLQNTWPYGYSMPIAVRYTQDACSRSGWL